ncbi:MAG: thiolase family protein [Methyloligellaceae bacterium]
MNSPSYIISARRTVFGKTGGLHGKRRLEQLAGPVIEAVCKDAGIETRDVNSVFVGNTTAGGGNPARLISLASGIPETTSAYTLDCQCASGLEAIGSAARFVSSGMADIVLAGAAESPSTAPWRLAKPNSIHQLPVFDSSGPFTLTENGVPELVEVGENIAASYKIDRKRQDHYTLESHRKAENGYEEHRFNGEIVAIRIEAGEGRDENLKNALSSDLMPQIPSYIPETGTVTSANSSALSDGAAFCLVVSETVFETLKRPPALRFREYRTKGVNPVEYGIGPISVINEILERDPSVKLSDIDTFEIGEATAVQSLACIDVLALDEAHVNKDGGALAFGHALGTGSAALVTRLFSQMVRQRPDTVGIPTLGLAAVGASGGLGSAMLLEAV